MTKPLSAGLEYIVQSNDTLERIAARYDCTPSQLMKQNKLTTRVIFPGQKISIPENPPPPTPPPPPQPADEKINVNPQITKKESITKPAENMTKIRESDAVSNVSNERTTSSLKFLKLNVKHFTDTEGVVSGVLLVTPNCIMFDPDVNHPLIIENGLDKYSMVAFMDVIISASLYKDVQTQANNDENGAFSTAETLEETSETKTDQDHKEHKDRGKETKGRQQRKKTFVRKCLSHHDLQAMMSSGTRIILQRSFSEEFCNHLKKGIRYAKPVSKSKTKKSKSDAKATKTMADEPKLPTSDVSNLPDSSTVSRKTSSSGLQPSTLEDEEPPSGLIGSNVRNLSKLRRSWRIRANTLGGTLVQGTQTIVQGTQNIGGSIIHGTQNIGGSIIHGTQNIGGSIIHGTQNIGGSIIQGTQNIGGSLIQGTQVVGRTVSLGAKAVVKVPQNLVSQLSTNIFAQLDSESDTTKRRGSDSDELDFTWLGSIEDIDESRKDVIRTRLKQQRELLKKLKKKTEELRENAEGSAIPNKNVQGSNVSAGIQDMTIDPCTEAPYYLFIKLFPVKKRKGDSRTNFSTVSPESKSEYWFTVPRQKVDTLYAFLIQWSPEKHKETLPSQQILGTTEHSGFLFLGGADHVELIDEPTLQPNSLPTGLNLNREWEIVTVDEVKRRLSILDLAEVDLVPLPDGSVQSLLLTEPMIRQIVKILPARAQSYPWVLIYSSEAHGFSLNTLYRNMSVWEHEISPVLLIIKDSNVNVFGAIVNCHLHMSDKFYGTGESLLYTFYPEFQSFPWQAVNNFIVKGNRDGLAIGAGHGRFGLWLDGDLFRGRTQCCATFENEPLTSTEDFHIAGIEAFGFRFGCL